MRLQMRYRGVLVALLVVSLWSLGAESPSPAQLAGAWSGSSHSGPGAKLGQGHLDLGLAALSADSLERKVAAASRLADLALKATPHEVRSLPESRRQEAARLLDAVGAEVSRVYQQAKATGSREELIALGNILSGLVGLIDRLDAPSSMARTLSLAVAGDFAGRGLLTRNDWRQKHYLEGWLALLQKSVDDTLTYYLDHQARKDERWRVVFQMGGLHESFVGQRHAVEAFRTDDAVWAEKPGDVQPSPLIYLAGPRSAFRTKMIARLVDFVLSNEEKVRKIDSVEQTRALAAYEQELREQLSRPGMAEAGVDIDATVAKLVGEKARELHLIQGLLPLDRLISAVSLSARNLRVEGADRLQYLSGALDVFNGWMKGAKTDELRLWLLDHGMALLAGWETERAGLKDRPDLIAKLDLLATYVRIGKDELLDATGKSIKPCARQLGEAGSR